jgi:hypothetical protein
MNAYLLNLHSSSLFDPLSSLDDEQVAYYWKWRSILRISLVALIVIMVAKQLMTGGPQVVTIYAP